MLEILDVKAKRIGESIYYTVVLNDGTAYAWISYWVTHYGRMFRALFEVEGVTLPRVMDDDGEYVWWDDAAGPGKVRALTPGEKMAYCRLEEIR